MFKIGGVEIKTGFRINQITIEILPTNRQNPFYQLTIDY